MFTPQMAAAKRKGLADYGLLAQRYVEDFAEKCAIRAVVADRLLSRRTRHARCQRLCSDSPVVANKLKDCWIVFAANPDIDSQSSM